MCIFTDSYNLYSEILSGLLVATNGNKYEIPLVRQSLPDKGLLCICSCEATADSYASRFYEEKLLDERLDER